MTKRDTPGLSGDELRMLRLSARVAASDLARRWAVHQTYISNVESQTRPTARTTAKYLEALRRAIADSDA